MRIRSKKHNARIARQIERASNIKSQDYATAVPVSNPKRAGKVDRRRKNGPAWSMHVGLANNGVFVRSERFTPEQKARAIKKRAESLPSADYRPAVVVIPPADGWNKPTGNYHAGSVDTITRTDHDILFTGVRHWKRVNLRHQLDVLRRIRHPSQTLLIPRDIPNLRGIVAALGTVLEVY